MLLEFIRLFMGLWLHISLPYGTEPTRFNIGHFPAREYELYLKAYGCSVDDLPTAFAFLRNESMGIFAVLGRNKLYGLMSCMQGQITLLVWDWHDPLVYTWQEAEGWRLTRLR